MANSEKLKDLFRRASKSFLQANPDLGLQSSERERVDRETLDTVLPTKAKSYERSHVIITAFTVRPRDPDNLGGGCKPLLDALRKIRLIPDDDPYSIELEVKQRPVEHFDQEKTLVEIEYR